ncbi:unnamed protein product [Paramecium pentaurelia]|uniref:Peptidase A1 domain-containing protein n=1 Tax=Paramecium pentaurelia TaxID=43138 RepID=A0A8S1WQX8_9CILI|nr:unnamed protein product [Paramecium pentaurelia]
MISLLLIILPQTFGNYFEQKLSRHVYEYKDVQKDDIVTSIKPQKCPNEFLDYYHNDTFVTQICFTKNVFYNVEVILGDHITNQSIFSLALDLTSPWTWYKSNSCLSCKDIKSLKYDNNKKCKNSKKIGKCIDSKFEKLFDATKWNDIKVHGQIYSSESLIQGTFQTDTIQLLAYNSSRKMTISQFLSYEWGNSTPPALVNITGLQMLQVDYINTELPILADGVIGFGFGYTETEEEKAQSNTDFVEKLVQEQTQLHLTRQQFALYTYESSLNFSEMVVQVGGFDYKYVHKQQQNVKWIQRLEKSGYYWMVQVDKIQFINAQGNDLINANLPINKALLTLNSQFIELPYNILISLIQSLDNSHVGTECNLVDDEMYLLYCKNYHFSTAIDYRLAFIFGEHTIPIDNYHLIYRKCESVSENQMIQNCLFNIKVSESDYIILGEPFIKNHYIVFENQPGNNVRRIGIMPAAVHMFYPDNPDYYEWAMLKLVGFIFIFGLLSICSVTFLRSLCKDLYRAFKYRRTLNPEDKLSLKETKDIEYVDYQTDEDIQIQQQIDNQNQQQNDDEKKVEEWKQQQEQFKFGEKFSNLYEQNAL